MHVAVPSTGRHIGSAQQDWRCFEACFHCSHFVKVNDGLQNPRYVTVWNPCCCAPFNNCCAPTCFNPVFTIPVYNADETEIVAEFENVWPGWNFRGLCGAGFSNWVVKFPEDATGDDKALLLSALFLQEFLHFERNSEK